MEKWHTREARGAYMIFCRACNNELWYDEDVQDDGTKIYYTCMCNECDKQLLQLRDVLHDNFKAVEAAVVALSANVLSGHLKRDEKKVASHALKAIGNIENVMRDING